MNLVIIPIVALVLFGIGLITMFTAALARPGAAWRLNLRLVGMFSTGASLGLMALGFLLPMVLVHRLAVRDIILTALAGYFSYDTLKKALAEKRAASSSTKS